MKEIHKKNIDCGVGLEPNWDLIENDLLTMQLKNIEENE